MDEKAAVDVQGSVSEEMNGVVRSIAGSPAGEIAYARTTADKKGTFRSFAGVLSTAGEWPAEDPYRLYWSDENTLVFMTLPPPAPARISPSPQKVVWQGSDELIEEITW
ncbi:hypothetical protein AB0C18_25455 [Nonomuraea muscovyensis]|uniref:Uncharacterized protein n=1 Tax=Nonomuraea muscovyensis TaxID=1124761 RepID=A0A7X0C2I3_9ACTN|nr:hypothetical protein [Nonomuraea muscovyensis]MBB6345479.1 hypothetical protein [Nonomuraea muscovyensis]